MVLWLAGVVLASLFGACCCLRQQHFRRQRGADKQRYTSVQTDVAPADDLDALIDDILKSPIHVMGGEL